MCKLPDQQYILPKLSQVFFMCSNLQCGNGDIQLITGLSMHIFKSLVVLNELLLIILDHLFLLKYSKICSWLILIFHLTQ